MVGFAADDVICMVICCCRQVVIDAHFTKSGLPHSILGVFFADGKTREKAEGVHAQYLQAYKGLNAWRFPLLHFSADRGFTRVK